MNTNKSKITKIIVGFLVLAVLICVVVMLTKYADQQENVNINRFTKWGVAFEIGPDRNATDFGQRMASDDKNLDIELTGTYSLQQAKDKAYLNLANIKGKTTETVLLNDSLVVTFPEKSYESTGKFDCPLVFYLGRDQNGGVISVDGKNYVGNKQGFCDAIAKAYAINGEGEIPSNTDVASYIDKYGPSYYISVPADRVNGSTNDNDKVTIDLTYNFHLI